MKFRTKPLVAAVLGLFLGALCLSGSALAAKSQTAAQDTGATSTTQTQTVSIVLQIRNIDALNKFIKETVDPNSPRFQQFLSVEEFAERYAPNQADIGRVKAALTAAGIQVNEVWRNHLIIRATGTTDQFNKFFATEVHNFIENDLRYTKPNRPLTVPSDLSDVVLTATGLDTKPKAHPMTHNLARDSAGKLKVSAASTLQDKSGTINPPGAFTVADFTQLYHVKPLYDAGVLGEGTTIGIATLATFDPADAYAYWKGVGLNVRQNRIKQVHVDGGAGTLGADETTLDVEQSGGIAPDARIVVYDAPNTDQGFIDVFFKAAEQNKVDSISVSWGATEFAQTPDVLTGQHEAFLELAAQGISVFAASGDEGAYDINNNQGGYTFPGCSQTLSVESPASDPLVVAAGGLTLAGTQTFTNASGATIGSVTVPKDRPWAWDYLENFFTATYGASVYYQYLFPVGGGGGVSVNYDVPFYQKNLPGVELTAGNQSLICQTSTGPQDLIDLPDAYAGRNLPDVSLNADPDTGYALYFNGAWSTGSGGTSFVAPQLNGITVLLNQINGGRVGYLNPQLYSLFRQYGYSNESPFKAITSGDNEYWQASRSYNPASGLGGLDVTKLARAWSIWSY